MKLIEMIKQEEEIYLDEGLKSFISDLLFTSDEKITTVVKEKPKPRKVEDEEVAEPFAGVCKFKNSILVPEKYSENEGMLVKYTAHMLRGSWAEKQEVKDCFKMVLKQLIYLHVRNMDFEHELEDGTYIDQEMIALAFSTGILKMDKNAPGYKRMEKILKRLLAHRKSLIDNMLNDPHHFTKHWEEAKTKLETAIKTIIRNGGETNMHIGMDMGASEKVKKKKEMQNKKKIV